jgi:hypothetical protein
MYESALARVDVQELHGLPPVVGRPNGHVDVLQRQLVEDERPPLVRLALHCLVLLVGSEDALLSGLALGLAPTLGGLGLEGTDPLLDAAQAGTQPGRSTA